MNWPNSAGAAGSADPACINDFLSDFLQEMEYLFENGVKVTPQKLVRTYICDAPARAFMTGTLCHTSSELGDNCIGDNSASCDNCLIGKIM